MADNKEFTQKLLDQKFTTFEDALKHWQAVYDLYFTELKRDITPLSSPPEGKENFVKTEQEERQKLEFMVEKIKTKSTQFALSASGTPKVDEVGPFGLLLLECLVTLLAVFQSTAKSSGKTKITNLQQEIIHVYERVDTLVQKTYVLHIQEKKIDDKTLPPLAGCVWSVCDGIKKVKMRDSGYASIATKNVFRVMKDALEELNDTIKEAKKQDRNAERDADDFLDCECVVPLPVLQSSHLLVRTTCSLCLNIEKLFFSTDPLSRSEDPIKTIKLCDNIVDRLKGMSERVDEVVSSAYDGEEEMEQQAGDLKKECKDLLALMEGEKELFKEEEWEKFVKMGELSKNMLK